MAIIKSNSSLVAFDSRVLYDGWNYDFLDYVQSFKLTTNPKRTNNKFLSNSNLIRKQFVKPEVLLELSYLQTNNFNNEKVFGFSKIYNETEKVSFASKLISFASVQGSSLFDVPFSNNTAYVLFSELNEDIVEIFYRLNLSAISVPDPNLMSKIISISLGNLFLNSYSFSYSINQLPVVNCSFLCSDLLISNLSWIPLSSTNPHMKYFLNSWKTGEKLYLNNTQFSDFKEKTSSTKEYLVLLMQDLIFENNFSSTSTPGPNIDNFLSGLIQSLDISIDFNRSEFYFFNSSNDVSSRQIIPPLKLKLSINGISNNFTTGSINSFFIEDSKFSCSILMGSKETNKNLNKLLFDELCIENFNYSIDVNGTLTYSIECYCEVTAEKGLRILELGVYDPTLNFVLSSDNYNLVTSDLFTVLAR